MKKLKLNGKLSLNKETVSRLSDNQMQDARGGFLSIGNYCTTADTRANDRCFGSDITDSLFCSEPQ